VKTNIEQQRTKEKRNSSTPNRLNMSTNDKEFTKRLELKVTKKKKWNLHNGKAAIKLSRRSF
jgi:hypothetical protein